MKTKWRYEKERKQTNEKVRIIIKKNTGRLSLLNIKYKKQMKLKYYLEKKNVLSYLIKNVLSYLINKIIS